MIKDHFDRVSINIDIGILQKFMSEVREGVTSLSQFIEGYYDKYMQPLIDQEKDKSFLNLAELWFEDYEELSHEKKHDLTRH